MTTLDYAIALVRQRLTDGGGIASYRDLTARSGWISEHHLGHAVARLISRGVVDWHPRTRMITLREVHPDDQAAAEDAAMLPT